MKRWLLVGIALGVTIMALLVGAVPLSVAQVIRGIGHPASPIGAILWNLRMPRIVLAFLVGGGLSVSGAALQALVRNPLAEPYLLGISGGAGLGAVAAIALGLAGLWAIPAAAFAGALASSALVYWVSAVQGARLEPRVLVLVGVVVSSFCGAITIAVLTMSDAAMLRNAFLWLLGGFGTANWVAVTVFSAYALIPLGFLGGANRMLDLLSLGDESAQALGIRTERAKALVFVTTAMLTAASVAVSGMIGFVGLVAPHAIRGWLGPLHRELLPAAFIAGGSLLVAADAVARTVVRPGELPIGAVTALIGVPLFALLLRRTLA